MITQYQRRRCITKYFFLLVFITLIHIVLLLTIFQAVLHVGCPKARISQVTVQPLHLNFSSPPSQTTKLASLLTLHNPTLGSFRLENGSLAFLYKQETEIGVGFINGVRVKPRSINTLKVITALNSRSVTKQDLGSFRDDIDSGLLPLTAHLKLDGEIQLVKFVRRKVAVESNCIMLVNLVLRDIQSFKCQ
uniref:Late embryogenesis abundant protein LEA-2 subgroup domain-containing protein n=1 Tax=Kalanchoe fedtschenkoi TaxID=63787 RepID=A0A7N0UPW4_KALFE